MKTKEEKELEFLRGMEKLKAEPIKSPDYKSPLNQDVMPVKGGVAQPEQVTRIKGMTEKIDTKGAMPLLSGDAFKNKIASRTGGKKLGLAAIMTALGASALPDSAMASTPVQAGLRALDEGDPSSFLTPPEAGNMEEEFQMLAERNAQEDYNNSPAAKDAKFARIRASLGIK